MTNPDPDARPRQVVFPAPIPFTGPWEYELRFPRDPRGPRIARTTLRAVLSAHRLDELSERAELLTSELATNAVRYASGPASVHLRWAHPVLRVSVSDTRPDVPVPLQTSGPEAERGRGLLILEVLADAWGGCRADDALPGADGKRIWFELALGDGPLRPGGTTDLGAGSFRPPPLAA